MEQEIEILYNDLEETYSRVLILLEEGKFDEVDDIEIKLKDDLTEKTKTLSNKLKCDYKSLEQVIFGIALYKREETYLKSVKIIK